MTTVENFLTAFPEFASVELSLVEAKLNEAALEVDVTIWGAKAPSGVAYLAAHKLALSPMGQHARLATDKGDTTYYKHYRALVMQVTSGFRVC